MTSPDLVIQARTIARVAFDTLRDKSKRRGAHLTNKVSSLAWEPKTAFRRLRLPRFYQPPLPASLLANATLIGFKMPSVIPRFHTNENEL
jgi:hypothetical protein